ncbi:MAG: hypothetical protein NDJ90_12250 [Oligoflexia bacterium]|nr:hypothetical protein [Oligoflexia bacterium]
MSDRRLLPLLAVAALLLSACESDGTAAPGGPDSGAPPAPSVPNAQTGSENIRARTFDFAGGKAVGMDFQQVRLEILPDPSASETIGRAAIDFVTLAEGRPYFLLNATIDAVRLDGRAISTETTTDPDGLNQVRVLSENVAPGGNHTLEVDYRLSAENVTYREGGVGLVTSMADIDSGNFFEKYGPTNFEDDQYGMTVTLTLQNTTTEHRLFTNGTVTQSGPTAWIIEFPAFYTTSSFYFHITDKSLAVRTGTHPGLQKEIPYTVYAEDSSSADSAASRIPGLLQELEGTYGAFLHPSFTAFISGAGGMEHAGATITSLSALGHEMTHSWFARGVMPSGGSSGWLDEAIASWRDGGYQRAGSIQTRSAENLADLSLFERFTPYAAYSAGAQLMSELDRIFAERFGGMRTLLAQFFGEFKGQTITTPQFETWLEGKTGDDLTATFERYVYGEGDVAGTVPGPGTPPPPSTLHPPALTQEEVEALR